MVRSWKVQKYPCQLSLKKLSKHEIKTRKDLQLKRASLKKSCYQNYQLYLRIIGKRRHFPKRTALRLLDLLGNRFLHLKVVVAYFPTRTEGVKVKLCVKLK